jgi:hypothetical protein
MGRRKTRKRDRRQERKQARRTKWEQPSWDQQADVTDEPFSPRTEEDGLLAIVQRRQAPKTCDRCYEFIPDAEGGRGRCMHIASGVFSPWSDTKACDFYRAKA